MSGISIDDFKKAILTILARDYSSNIEFPKGITPVSKAHKFNLIGKGDFQHGDLEYYFKTNFSEKERGLAMRAFDELKRDWYIQSTGTDLIDPENWVRITELGAELLQNNMKDKIDLVLETIDPHFLELRRGMRDAIKRNSPDAARQAAHSARELIDQFLKDGSPENCKTRKERIKHIMDKYRGIKSESDIKIIEATCKLVEAEHDKITALSHQHNFIKQSEVESCIDSVDRILKLLIEN